MIKHNKLFLGSQSVARQQLLKESNIPFVFVGHSFDESRCSMSSFSLQKIVEQIALSKMEHVCLPLGQKAGEVCFVLTADTLCLNGNGVIEGKPVDKADAIQMLKNARSGAQVGTAFCLDKRVFKNNEWQVIKRIQKFVSADYTFAVPDDMIDAYLRHSQGISTAGAITIEQFGQQFLKEVRGSYSTIIGLPMFELREALVEIGFY